MALMEGRMTKGLLISLETAQVRREVETVSLGMTLHNITPLPHPQVQSRLWS